MDCDQRCRGAGKRYSLLRGDEFNHKILSRNSSVGYSSRIYYHRSTEGVPFKWEMQPGTPKDPPKDEGIPPLIPPPAVLSLGLPKPCIEVQPNKAKTWPRIRFWNKSKKNKQRSEDHVKAGPRRCHDYTTGSDKFERFEFCSSDHEFMTSPRISSSSSSSSLSFSNGPSLQSSRLQSPGRDSFRVPLSCSPWNISTILSSIARHV
ncbi:hypothetical protein I3842_07G195100 [Carya illinoinensis]|uniref:Uncharacterized protein n=1 Tax=Carya illinoinensis TaxID=32201 RepID=A0A922JFG9_CARIL|nr:hypothetical protein I3842_07G195100 [Carya illinoinensis]